MTGDVIDGLAGIAPGSVLDGLRANRMQARLHSQASHDALFAPRDASHMSLSERQAVAAFVALLHGEASSIQLYPAFPAIAAEAGLAKAAGPYGAYPPGPLNAEDVPGPTYRVSPAGRAALGPRLVAALEHAHMLVFHPRDAAAAPLQALLDAGWDTDGIVTLSQLVAFLAYQTRVAAGLRILAAHPKPEDPA